MGAPECKKHKQKKCWLEPKEKCVKLPKKECWDEPWEDCWDEKKEVCHNYSVRSCQPVSEQGLRQGDGEAAEGGLHPRGHQDEDQGGRVVVKWIFHISITFHMLYFTV